MSDTTDMSKSHTYWDPDLRWNPELTDEQIPATLPLSTKAKQLLITIKKKNVSVLKKSNIEPTCVIRHVFSASVIQVQWFASFE